MNEYEYTISFIVSSVQFYSIQHLIAKTMTCIYDVKHSNGCDVELKSLWVILLKLAVWIWHFIGVLAAI